ncbi:MAG: GNAT family N-acetyltransferase [Actinomycetota bacterium]
MEVLRPADARSFLDIAGPLLMRDEGRHNLILGIAGTTERHPDLYPEYHAWVVRNGDEVLAAATMTPPHKLVVADPLTDDAADALLQAVRATGIEVPGVVANLPTAPWFAGAWSDATGAGAELVRSEGVYALNRVLDVPVASGLARRATSDDRALLEMWLKEFADEALPGEESNGEQLQRSIDTRLSSAVSGFWIWEDGDIPVSLAGYSGPTTSGIRIGPVYTPPDLRRRGYASNLVAGLSRWLLDDGYKACFLYTDLANPTSNKIYTDIGYVRVCDAAEYAFRSP